jgi:hypothetical protein
LLRKRHNLRQIFLIFHANDVERYFRFIKERALSADFETKQEIIRLFTHQVIINRGQMVIRAYLPNPIPAEFLVAHSAHQEDLVSTPLQSSASLTSLV